MIAIRKMEKGDFARVSELLHTCYRWLGEREGFTPAQVELLISERASLEHLSEIAESRLCFVACLNEVPVGLVAIVRNEIDKFYVDPDYHRRGIGAALFRAAEQAIAKVGYDDMFLGAIGRTPIPFYERMGMTVDGYKISRTGGKVVLLRKRLKPDRLE